MTEAIPMRREKQRLSRDVCEEVLRRGTSGVLALADPEHGVPYQVPLSYGYHGGRLTFHGARVGHKVGLIGAGAPASFTVIDLDDVVPERYTTNYRSVTCTGTARLLDDEAECRAELAFMAERFWPGHPDEANAEIERFLAQTGVIVLEVETMTGKEATELARQRAAREL